MSNTMQTDTQSVLEHGISVNKYFKDLYAHLTDATTLQFGWRLPEWINTHKDFILDNLHDLNVVQEYQIMHDCGKPYCLKTDEEGRRHFPNHACVSGDIYAQISSNKIVKSLIENDMVFHTIKSEEFTEFVNNTDIKTVVTLLITSLCEIHSNAAMFGGITSTSFLIKWKQIEKRGKQLINQIAVKVTA